LQETKRFRKTVPVTGSNRLQLIAIGMGTVLGTAGWQNSADVKQ